MQQNATLEIQPGARVHLPFHTGHVVQDGAQPLRYVGVGQVCTFHQIVALALTPGQQLPQGGVLLGYELVLGAYGVPQHRDFGGVTHVSSRVCPGRFCCGDKPTIADICLVAHLTSAKMLCDSEPAPYPTARRILDACMQIEAFALEHPLRQAGAQTAAPI